MRRRDRTRATVFRRLDEIRDLRNRVSHHEPVWDRDLVTAEERILDALGWMNRNLADAIRRESLLGSTVASGFVSFRPLVERHVRPLSAPPTSPAVPAPPRLP